MAREKSSGMTLGEFAGRPRSFVWKQGAVHLRTAESAKAAPDLHAHFAIQLTVGITHPAQLRTSHTAPRRSAPAWLVGSDQPHWGRTIGPVATVFFDPLSPDGRRVSTLLGGSGVLAVTSSQADAIRQELNLCWDRGWTGNDLQAAAGRIAVLLAPDPVAPAPIDPRIQIVVDALVRTSSENVSLSQLAKEVGLSESRLSHLFREEVGLPMRQYRLTLRMQEAVAQIAAGRSLTEAAHAAGFADSAHFSRICRRMFGSAPSGLPSFKIEAPR